MQFIASIHHNAVIPQSNISLRYYMSHIHLARVPGYEPSILLIKNPNLVNRNYEKLRKSARSFFMEVLMSHPGVRISSRSFELCEIFSLEHCAQLAGKFLFSASQNCDAGVTNPNLLSNIFKVTKFF